MVISGMFIASYHYITRPHLWIGYLPVFEYQLDMINRSSLSPDK